MCVGLFRTIAVWDYSESKYWQPYLGSNQKRFVPSEIVAPNLQDIEKDAKDLGKVVSIKSLYSKIDVELLDGYNTKEVKYTLSQLGLLFPNQ